MKHSLNGRFHPELKTEELLKLYENGESTCSIAKRFKISPQSIFSRFRKANIKSRSISEAVKLAFKTGRLNQFGERNWNWKGGKHLTPTGYIYMKQNNKSILEHRLVWEQHYGKLPSNWIVHHLNGKRTDNRIENLSAMPRKRHSPTLIVEAHKKRINELEHKIKILEQKSQKKGD